jgi:DNA invertase Pin-like site-specific DNA recombinase
VVVTKLDRLTRSLLDFAELAERVPLVVLEQGFDMTTSHGRAMAGMLAVFAQFERELIGERTRAGLSVIRSQGRPISRPAVVDQPEVAERVAAMRASGMTLQAIADTLNRDGIPTIRGGTTWRPSSVQSATGYQRPRPRPQSPELPTRTAGRRRRSS